LATIGAVVSVVFLFLFFSLVQDLIAREALSRWQFLHLEVE